MLEGEAGVKLHSARSSTGRLTEAGWSGDGEGALKGGKCREELTDSVN